jgi:hypothetical protein
MANEELRDRLVMTAREYSWSHGELTDEEEFVGAILVEIRAAGYVLVPTDRLERLRFAAGRDDAVNPLWRSLLKPGDLDRAEGGE